MKLVADIGGTHARFALLDEHGTPSQIHNLRTADFADLNGAITAYALAVQPALVNGVTHRNTGNSTWPLAGASAVISIAAPLAGDRVRMTNAAWDFSIGQTQADLGLHMLRLINDFEALALAIPTLTATELQAIGHSLPLDSVRTKAIIGPGTGLGMAGVMPTQKDGAITWHAIPCEGGHASFAPSSASESALLNAAWDLGLKHVCWEDFVSGTGLPLLYQCICRNLGLGRSDDSASKSPAQITNGALQLHDEACLATLTAFCDLLGSAAGDLALMTGARGGVYIKGGVLDRVLEIAPHFLANSGFRQRFESKGAYSSYLQSIPTWFITAEQLALRGCATL
jgi:glucokinase